jgi:hypothetical protein
MAQAWQSLNHKPNSLRIGRKMKRSWHDVNRTLCCRSLFVRPARFMYIPSADTVPTVSRPATLPQHTLPLWSETLRQTRPFWGNKQPKAPCRWRHTGTPHPQLNTHDLAALFPKKERPVQSNGRLRWPQSWSERFGEQNASCTSRNSKYGS